MLFFCARVKPSPPVTSVAGLTSETGPGRKTTEFFLGSRGVLTLQRQASRTPTANWHSYPSPSLVTQKFVGTRKKMLGPRLSRGRDNALFYQKTCLEKSLVCPPCRCMRAVKTVSAIRALPNARNCRAGFGCHGSRGVIPLERQASRRLHRTQFACCECLHAKRCAQGKKRGARRPSFRSRRRKRDQRSGGASTMPRADM